MPRPRTNPPSSYSHGQASYVLDRLISDRRISPGEVSRYINDMQSEINDLERRLEQLRAATTGGGSSSGGMSSGGGATPSSAPRRRGRPPGSANRGPGRPPGSANRGPGRPPGRPPGSGASASASAAPSTGRRRGRSAITAEQLASRQLQGRYLGLIRQIPASRRGQYQRTAKEKGREAAIREMQDVLKK